MIRRLSWLASIAIIVLSTGYCFACCQPTATISTNYPGDGATVSYPDSTVLGFAGKITVAAGNTGKWWTFSASTSVIDGAAVLKTINAATTSQTCGLVETTYAVYGSYTHGGMVPKTLTVKSVIQVKEQDAITAPYDLASKTSTFTEQ